MKERGKAVEVLNEGNYFTDDYYSSSDLPCRKHPSSSSVGICAYCLKDRLVKLVCSDCGEQRLSSCSCSEISSSYTNSGSVEVGSVGRISFLIENEKTDQTPHSNSKPKCQEKAEKVILLKRSSSSHGEIKRSTGFCRKIGKFFRKKRDHKNCERSSVNGGFDEKSDIWVCDYMGVSRSRSLCSFRGGGLIGSEDGGGDFMSVSAARSSSVNGGLLMESGKRSGFSEAEARKSGFDHQVLEFSENGSIKNPPTKRVFKIKESDFTAMDDDSSGFIDLKLELSSESKPEFSAVKKMSDLSSSDLDAAFTSSLNDGSFRSLMMGDGHFSNNNNGGSCRITVNERGIKKSRKSLKVWRWIFRHHYHHHNHHHRDPNCEMTRKKDEDHGLIS